MEGVGRRADRREPAALESSRQLVGERRLPGAGRPVDGDERPPSALLAHEVGDRVEHPVALGRHEGVLTPVESGWHGHSVPQRRLERRRALHRVGAGVADTLGPRVDVLARSLAATVPRTWSFAVLGPLQVTGPDGPVAMTGKRERVVLSLLVASVDEAVSRERLAEALWGERPPPSSVQVIHNVVSGLRRVLGRDVIETRPGGYVLRVEPDAVDIRRFDRLLREGRRHAEAEDWQRAARALAEAAALWRGAPLDEIADRWNGLGDVARLTEEQRCVFEELAEAQLGCGRHREWVAPLEAMVLDEPLREHRWSMLMLALHRSGRHADALRAYQRARSALAEVGLEPRPALVSLERELSGHLGQVPGRDVSGVRGVRRGNLPRPLTRLVGRADEVQHHIRDVGTGPLVTLTGAGGVGKTRLALEIAEAMVDRFPDGTWLIELAPVATADAVLGAVASTLSVRQKPGMAMDESIVDWLAGRQVLLLVDNCEHVLDGVAPLVGHITRRCETVTVLATSREPMGIPGERVHIVPPLAASSAGVELFCERASAADGSFRATDDDRMVISSICSRLDGMPLAIEIAAARIRSSTPQEILRRIDDRFRLLRSARHSRESRHHTLQAAVDWSYQLLDEDERRVFDRASTFAGGFDLDAATALCSDVTSAPAVVEVLDSLVDKSMLLGSRSDAGLRYGMLETLRDYGQARLDTRGARAGVRDRHLEHYLGVARAAEELWTSPRQLDAHRVYDAEWENFRRAHSWALTGGRLAEAHALVAATAPHAMSRLIHEHGAWALRALAAGGCDRQVRAVTCGWAAYWALIAADHDKAIGLGWQGVAAAPAPDHPDTMWCWAVLVWAHAASGRTTAVHELGQRSRAAALNSREPRDAWWREAALVENELLLDEPDMPGAVARYATWAGGAGAPSLLARAAFYDAQMRLGVPELVSVPAASASYERALQLARHAGDVNMESRALGALVGTTTMLRVPESAWSARDALARLYEAGLWSVLWGAVETVPWRFLGTSASEVAAVIFGHIHAHRPDWHFGPARRARAEGLAAVRRLPRADELMAVGAAMTDHELVAYVLDQLSRRGSDPGRLLDGDEVLERILGR